MTLICMSQLMFFAACLACIVFGVCIGYVAFAPIRGD
jgi:hypothetical protein